MAKKSGKHPVFSYIRSIIFGIIMVALIIYVAMIGLNDQRSQATPGQRRFTDHMEATLVGYYNRNNKSLQRYVYQRAHHDLGKASPQVKQVNAIPKKLFNHSGKANISHVTMDDTDNGTFLLNGKTYLFQLADIQFAPHNSQFYKKNHQAIQADIQHEIGSGKFSIAKSGKNQIDLYKNNQLVGNNFLSKGIAYVPDLSNHKALVDTEESAKAKKVGMWSIPNIVGGNSSTQIYSVSAENGHKIPTAGVSNNQQGGQSITQSIKSWFANH